jgi:23S rRNA (pseudouridine1915-N3)-methyltransferase
MKLRLVCVGKTKNTHLATVGEDFIARIGRFVPLDAVNVKEPKMADEQKRIQAEGVSLFHAINASDYVVALDADGRSHTSESFATFIGRHMAENPRDLTFIVGGHAGLSDKIKQRANLLISLSDMTFSHDLARTVLLEQIYRTLTIIRNHPYAR